MTKTAEQVVAEALGIHADHPDMWDLEARDVVNALREAGMLRDAHPVVEGRCATCGSEVFEGDADAVIAHLDADTTAETEWEYRALLKNGKEIVRGTIEEVHKMKTIDIERRRKAGKWEEIPNE